MSKCPRCGYEEPPSVSDKSQWWKYDLIFLSRHKEPIWGSPKKRGIDLKEIDAHLAYLVKQGLAIEVEDGFIISEKGYKYAQQLKPLLGFKT